MPKLNIRSQAKEGWTRVYYKCAQCGAEDRDDHLVDSQPAPAINCWKCHAGRNLDIQQQLISKKGMFPVIEAPNA